MKSSDAYAELRRIGRPIIETREATTRLGITPNRVIDHLRSLEQAGLIRQLRSGLWSLQPNVDPFTVPPYLTAPFPAYVSVWSALSHHGMIEQIPKVVSVASTDRGRRVPTSVATFRIHHLAPELFDGFTGSPQKGYIATAEKALFDTVYLRSQRGGDVSLPELELPEPFDSTKLSDWTTKINSTRLQTLVERGIETVLSSVA